MLLQHTEKSSFSFMFIAKMQKQKVVIFIPTASVSSSVLEESLESWYLLNKKGIALYDEIYWPLSEFQTLLLSLAKFLVLFFCTEN
jgi:hypothetical protein